MIPNNIFSILCKMNPALSTLQNMNTPDELAQYLLNTGRVNQQQVNQARQMWQNPNIQQQVYSRFNSK